MEVDHKVFQEVAELKKTPALILVNMVLTVEIYNYIFNLLLMSKKSDSTEVIKVSDNNFDFGQFYFSYAKYHYNEV